ncbi:MAG: ECF transporter S component [Clostridiales bacterium]|nr:ECF transporter S component [Clostridiales bacterium]
MINKRKDNVLKMVQTAMLVAISIVSLYVVPLWSIFPSSPFLQYDMADVPVLIGTLLFGPGTGLLILGLVSVIQGLTISAASGWVGIVMHFCASGALVLLAGIFYKKKKTFWPLIAGLVLGSLSMTALMVPLNLFFTVRFFGVPYEAVKDMLIPVIIPFNLIKGGLNSAIAAAVFFPVKNILERTNLLQKNTTCRQY